MLMWFYSIHCIHTFISTVMGTDFVTFYYRKQQIDLFIDAIRLDIFACNAGILKVKCWNLMISLYALIYKDISKIHKVKDLKEKYAKV